MNVTVNFIEGKCLAKDTPVTVSDAPGPPIDDKVCIDPPPTPGNYHLSAVNGVVQGTWVQD